MEFAVRNRWPVLILWATAAGLSHVRALGISWHFIVAGSRALFSPNGLALFALHPDLQMGPLTFLAAAPFTLLLPAGLGMWLGFAFLLAVGLLLVRELRSVMRPDDALAERRWLLVSMAVLVGWGEIAVHYGHLDDAMALLFAVVAVRLVRSEHPYLAALAVAVAIDFKPWAVPVIAVLLLAPAARRWRAVLLAAAVVAAVWVPFAVGAGTGGLNALTFTLPVDPSSSLHLLTGAGSTPFWCRPVQLLGGLALALVAVRSGRWSAAVMLVVALRMLVDPTTHNYYDVGLLIGTGIFDLVVLSRVIPWATLSAATLIYLPSYLDVLSPQTIAVTRAIGLVSLLLLGLLMRPRRSTTSG